MAEKLDIEQFNRIVDGAGAMVFVGPYTSHVAGHRYVTLTSYGEKEEGASLYPSDDEGPTIWTEAEAIFRFKKVLSDYLSERAEGRQFAWRRFPAFSETEHGDCCVTARCVLIPVEMSRG